MKRQFILCLALAALLCPLVGCGSLGSGSGTLSASEGEVRVYEVFGMDCPGCHGGVEKLVKKIPAVQDAQANWQAKELTVVVRPGSDLDDEDIHDAVRRANFTPGKRIR